MRFQITTLMENTADQDFLAAEHGLSLLIEGEGCRVLYDTGASPRFLLNAKTLQADLKDLDALVLSHGHYDHTGGAAALLAKGQGPKAVYLGRDFFQERFGKKGGGLMEIGALIDKEMLERIGVPQYEVGADPVRLAEGVWLVSGFSAEEPLERPIPTLLRRTGDGLETDRFQDEVAVVLETERELALLSGCAHVGILSMCGRVSRLFGRPVNVFVGGTHLMAADDRRIEETCALLQKRGVERLGACHCSGERAGSYFADHFPGFFQNHVGSRVTVG